MVVGSTVYKVANHVSDLLYLLPKSNDRTKSIRKMKKQIFAIPAAPAAIPPKPRKAAISAIIKKIIVQRNIIWDFG